MNRNLNSIVTFILGNEDCVNKPSTDVYNLWSTHSNIVVSDKKEVMFLLTFISDIKNIIKTAGKEAFQTNFEGGF